MFAGKCPKCEKTITRVNGKHVEIVVSLDRKLHGISYSCPSCNTVISIQVDPIAIKTDTINGLLEKLKKRGF